MIQCLQWATLVWLTYALIISVRRLKSGDRSSLLLVFPVFYTFFALPLFYDLILGTPVYLDQPGFAYADRDVTVTVTYCLFIALVPIIWLGFLRRTHYDEYDCQKALQKLKRVRVLLFAVLLTPAVLICWAPDPSVYAQYGFIVSNDMGRYGTDIVQFHSYIMASTFVAMMAAAGLVAGSTRPWRRLALLAPFLVAAVWLNGKRAILAVAIVMILTALWLSGRVRGRKLLLTATASLMTLMVFSYWYQLSVRNLSVTAARETSVYDNFRVDYSRDSRVKMAMFAELNPATMSILEFRGQSLLFYVTAFVPRAVWPEKPFTYACYFTSAMLGSSPRDWGWGMTTSVFDEAIANGSWLGLLVAPCFIGFLCRIGDSCSDSLIFLLTAVIASLLLTVEPIAFAPLFLIWTAMVAKAKVRLT